MDLFRRDIQRWNKAHSIVVCSAGEQQQALIFCRMDYIFDKLFGFVRAATYYKLSADHQA